MKRDVRKLNRVRRVAELIAQARQGGWVREVEAWRSETFPDVNAPGAGFVPVVVVRLTMPASKTYSSARASFYFWRHWTRDGWTISAVSRYGRGRKRNGAVAAERLISNLSSWQGYAVNM